MLETPPNREPSKLEKCRLTGRRCGGTLLATKGGTVAILAQGTSWAVAVTQAFLAAVQIPRVWVLGLRGLPPDFRGAPREDRLWGRGLGATEFIFSYFRFLGF